jgi:hypothetical protein
MSPELSSATSPTPAGHGGGTKQDGPRDEIMGSLGEALAGVNLGANNGHQGGFSFHSEHASGTPFNLNSQANNGELGWGFGADPSRGTYPGTGQGGQGAPPNQEPSTPQAAHESKKSIDLFLSQSPSKMLGSDVFKVSTNDLPGLALTGGLPLGNGNISASPGNFSEVPRRRTESPQSAVTGTATSSRSGSPLANGEGGRSTIQAYHGYEAPSAPAASQGVDESDNPRLQSPYKNLGGNFSGFRSPYNPPTDQSTPQGKQPMQQQQQKPPQQHQHQQPPQQQQQQQQQPNVNPQQQVLYMAVPTPDGRGQVLQPVQMVQLPGKPFAYVVPGQGGMPGMQPVIPDAQQAPPMMVMPSMQMQQPPAQPNELMGGLMPGGARNQVQNKPMGYGDVSSPGQYANDASVRDDFNTLNQGMNQGIGGAGNQYMPPTGDMTGQAVPGQTDPLSSLYSTPQRPPLDALLGQVRRLSRDQVGCRLVQQALDEEGANAATLILNEGLPFWGEAMVDPFGNYLFQKILEKITAEERVMLVKSVSTRLVNASLNLHGTRSVQKIVELCSLDEYEGQEPQGDSAADLLTRALAPAAARLCIDSHGNHVIQRILLKLGHKHAKFVFDAVAESVGDVARHRHGCCVIQRCLDSPISKARSRLVHRIVDKSLELMQDAYGNYVVQYVLDVCSDEDVHAVCESVVGKVNLLAIQKFSSNVMEKCLERCTDRVKEHYMAELSEGERIRELMMDPFGNYVVQRALSVSTHTQAVRLVEAMRPHLLASQPGTPNGQRNGGVRNTAGGRRIMAKICRRFPNFTLTPTGTTEELYSQNKGHHRHQHHNPAMGPPGPYGQLPPSPHHHQHHPQHFGGNQHHLNLGAHQPYEQHQHQPYEQHQHQHQHQPYEQHQPYPDQRQPYYDMGDASGYYQHAPHMGHGAYPSL